MVLQTVCPLAILEGYGFKTKVMVKSDCCGKERDKTGDNSGMSLQEQFLVMV